MKIKNILYVRTSIINEELKMGGSVAHAIGIINAFKKKDIKVFVSSSCMVDIFEELNLDGFKKLGNPRCFSWLRWRFNCLISNIFFTLQILLFIKEKPIDIIYQRHGILNCIGVLVSYFKNITLVLEYNGSVLWADKNWNKTKPVARFSFLISFFENISLKYATYIIVVSKALKDELIARGIIPKKILVNPNGVDCNEFNPAVLTDDRACIRKKLGIENKCVFGFIGTFSFWHGVSVLQKVIAKVIAKNANVHFLLIGDGPLKNELEGALELENQFVTLTGAVAQNDAKKYLAACDAYLCPTIPNQDGTPFFGSPTKLFEYMGMGKPIVASNLGQIAEVMKGALDWNIYHDDLSDKFLDVCGILVEPDNVEQLFEAALFIANLDGSIKDKMGFHARNLSIKFYTWEHNIHKLITFVEKA